MRAHTQTFISRVLEGSSSSPPKEKSKKRMTETRCSLRLKLVKEKDKSEIIVYVALWGLFKCMNECNKKTLNLRAGKLLGR